MAWIFDYSIIEKVFYTFFSWLNNPVIHLDGSRLAAIALLAVALFFIYKSNIAAKAQAEN